jgi:hypothetical protein
MSAPSLGQSTADILNAFRAADREFVGRKITEAAIVGGGLRFRWQGASGRGRLGVVVGDIGIRDATSAEYDELEDAVSLGQVQIYRTDLYRSGRSRLSGLEVIHQATGRPLAALPGR